MADLQLTIKKEYFDQIVSGEKTEEFRIIKPYWVKRLVNRNYDRVIIRNGYASNAPTISLEYLGYELKNITHPFFGDEQVSVFAIKLGKGYWIS